MTNSATITRLDCRSIGSANPAKRAPQWFKASMVFMRVSGGASVLASHDLSLPSRQGGGCHPPPHIGGYRVRLVRSLVPPFSFLSGLFLFLFDQLFQLH